MLEKKNPRTTRDALIIDAIGDIGELIKRIEDLDSVTRSMVVELESKLMDAMSVVEKHASDKQSEFQVFTESERKSLEEKLHASVEKAARHLEQVGKRLVREVERPAGLSVWAQIFIALVISVTGGAISVWGSYWLFGRELGAQAEVGRAVMEVWNELDEKCKARIEQAY